MATKSIQVLNQEWDALWKTVAPMSPTWSDDVELYPETTSPFPSPLVLAENPTEQPVPVVPMTVEDLKEAVTKKKPAKKTAKKVSPQTVDLEEDSVWKINQSVKQKVPVSPKKVATPVKQKTPVSSKKVETPVKQKVPVSPKKEETPVPVDDTGFTTVEKKVKHVDKPTCSKCGKPRNPNFVFCYECNLAAKSCPQCGGYKSPDFDLCGRCAYTCACGNQKSPRFPTCTVCCKK